MRARHPADVARLGRCSSSGSTRSTRYGCPKCQGQMKVVALIEPPQGAVIEKTLRHCGLRWPDADWDSQPISSEQSGELTYVDMDEFLATF